MDLTTLDSFSRDFGRQLFSIYPEWASLAKPGRIKDATSDHVIVEVPPPPRADLASTLLIYTENQEVTVGFDYVHVHFFPQAAIPLNSDALDFIASILSEKLAAVSEWRDNIWRGSWTCEKEEEEEEDIISPGPGSHIRIRSWNGSRDRDIRGPDVACTGNPK
jgi:hypothetical protein